MINRPSVIVESKGGFKNKIKKCNLKRACDLMRLSCAPYVRSLLATHIKQVQLTETLITYWYDRLYITYTYINI
jgi:hypothetical protein